MRILERDPAAATALNGAGRSALHCVATRTGAMPCTRAAVMRALLAAAPRMAIAQDADGLTPLALAVDAGNAESVALLARAVPVAALAREAYLDGTPLHRAGTPASLASCFFCICLLASS